MAAATNTTVSNFVPTLPPANAQQYIANMLALGFRFMPALSEEAFPTVIPPVAIIGAEKVTAAVISEQWRHAHCSDEMLDEALREELAAKGLLT